MKTLSRMTMERLAARKFALIGFMALIAVGCGQSTVESSAAETKSEIARLSAENQTLPGLRQTNEEVARLRTENEALPALRNQYRQLQSLQRENDFLRSQLNKTSPTPK